MSAKEKEAIAGLMASHAERLREVEARQKQLADLLAQQGKALREVVGHVTEVMTILRSAAERGHPTGEIPQLEFKGYGKCPSKLTPLKLTKFFPA